MLLMHRTAAAVLAAQKRLLPLPSMMNSSRYAIQLIGAAGLVPHFAHYLLNDALPLAPAPTCRYAIQLIGAASLVAQKRKAAAVDVEDVSKAYTLFLDVQRSVQYLQVRSFAFHQMLLCLLWVGKACQRRTCLLLVGQRSVQYLQVGWRSCLVSIGALPCRFLLLCADLLGELPAPALLSALVVGWRTGRLDVQHTPQTTIA